MNNRFWNKAGDFVLGKGFYIVLFLCVATIGISGYYLMQSVLPEEGEDRATGADTSMVLPDSEANGPNPVSREPARPQILPQTKPQPRVSQPDDPEPVKETMEPEPVTLPEQKPVATVFTWPVKGAVLRDFSVETLSPDPTLGDWRTHGGLDIASVMGTKVLAMGAGTVCEVFEDGLMGTTVVIDHGQGLTTTYANLGDNPLVEPGDRVDAGSVIGCVGDSALVESGLEGHLHLEACRDGKTVDPRDYLPQLG